MFTQKFKKLGLSLLGNSVLAIGVVLVVISAFFVTHAYAATRAQHPGKTIGAKLIVNGKTIILTPASSTAMPKVAPNASQNCVTPATSITNVHKSSSAAYFNYTLRIYNFCPSGVSVTSGYWNSRGSITCDGVAYSNPPTGSGRLPVIASGKSALVQDNVPYAAICVGEIFGIPYEYPPSQVSIATLTNGTLSNKNLFANSVEDVFFP